MENYKPHTKCRACNSSALAKYLDFGFLPLSNNLEKTQEEAIKAERYPLEIQLCKSCGLSQLSVVVNPEKLYSYYTYRSSVNEGYKKHCREMAKNLKANYAIDVDSFQIDIASNDGALLKEFKEEIGLEVLGVDPAKNLAKIAQEGGVPTIDDFWNLQVASRILDTYGKADLITATNVFAHVDNIQEFIEAAKLLLKPNGILVIECPYMGDHLDQNDPTQTYFEHLSYMSITPIYLLCKKKGMKLTEVSHQSIHGGTMRYIISHKDSLFEEKNIVGKGLDLEYDKRFYSFEKYDKWAFLANEAVYDLSLEIGSLKIRGFKVAAFSASAKGNILLNSAQLSYNDIEYIVDETPEKIGKYSPGTGIPIVSIYSLISTPPDYLLLLSWNFKDEIIEKVKKLGYKGKFIIPLPNIKYL